MATIKITPSQSKVRETAVPQTGALTLPMSIATQQGQAFGAVGKVIEDIHKEQVAVEDNNNFLKIIKEAAIDIENISSSVSKNSDVKFAVDTFEKLTPANKWESLTKNQRPAVKKKFNQWLEKTKANEYVSIARKVKSEHVKDTKQTNKEYLDGLTLKAASSDIEKASGAFNDITSWFNNPANKAVYTDQEFAKLKEDKNNQAKKYRVIFGAKNHPNYVIKNYEKIKSQIPPGLAAEALETAKQKIAANNDFEIKQEELEGKAAIKKKVGIFTELLLRIKNDADPEYLGKLPTLDLLNDLRKADQINTAQYEALLRFYKDPKAADDDAILDLINGQIFIADTVEELDAIQDKINISPEYLASIGIRDATTMTSLIDKYKNDRQAFQDHKHYLRILNDILGKTEGTVIRAFGAKEQTDQKLRTKASRLYNEYLDEGLSAEQAFLKVSEGYLFRENKIPTVYDVAEITSFKLPEIKADDQEKDPSEIFQGWRNKVYDAYSKGEISIEELKRDISSLDTMEDIHGIRAEFGAATNNKSFAWSKTNQATGVTADVGR